MSEETEEKRSTKMADKPQITATIKFRGVTVEDMTIEELRELRDMLNQLVGPKEYVPYPVYPSWQPYGTWCITTSGASSNLWASDLSGASNTFSLNGNTDLFKAEPSSEHAHYTLTLN